MSARTILTVLLSCAAPALGYYEGTITAPDVILNPGETKTVEITITGPVSIDAIGLNLQIGNGAWPEYTGGPWLLAADLVGPGLLFHNFDQGQETYLITEQMLLAQTYFPFAGNFLTIPAGESRTLARVVIDAGEASGVWPLSLTSLNGPTEYYDMTGQKYPALVDGRIWVPEPASLLLALAGGGLVLGRGRAADRR